MGLGDGSSTSSWRATRVQLRRREQGRRRGEEMGEKSAGGWLLREHADHGAQDARDWAARRAAQEWRSGPGGGLASAPARWANGVARRARASIPARASGGGWERTALGLRGGVAVLRGRASAARELGRGGAHGLLGRTAAPARGIGRPDGLARGQRRGAGLFLFSFFIYFLLFLFVFIHKKEYKLNGYSTRQYVKHKIKALQHDATIKALIGF
jgi:hypothetical protein